MQYARGWSQSLASRFQLTMWPLEQLPLPHERLTVRTVVSGEALVPTSPIVRESVRLHEVHLRLAVLDVDDERQTAKFVKKYGALGMLTNRPEVAYYQTGDGSWDVEIHDEDWEPRYLGLDPAG